ncbi:hypothetical protein F5146DRAFT_317045 [Armillaria mellea]|nr:hypothetical protein F5146DRAFT_317045 [Armillaria mellea]
MRFSLATLLPLALAVPALSASVQTRDGSYGGCGPQRRWQEGLRQQGLRQGQRQQGQWSWRLHLGAGVRAQQRLARGGTRASTLPTTTRMSTRSPSRSSARVSVRRMTSVTLARLTSTMRRTKSSSASCLSRSSTSTLGRMTVMMAKTAKTTRMARRMTRSTTTLLAGTPTTDTKSDELVMGGDNGHL